MRETKNLVSLCQILVAYLGQPSPCHLPAHLSPRCVVLTPGSIPSSPSLIPIEALQVEKAGALHLTFSVCRTHHRHRFSLGFKSSAFPEAPRVPHLDRPLYNGVISLIIFL